MFTNQSEDSERCESMELDNKIRDLIERNASLDPKGVSPEATPSHRNSCSPKTPEKTASIAHFVQDTLRMSAAESSTEHAECSQSSRRKNLTNSLEPKIRYLEKQRKELLEVNQQWYRQFRSMKDLYERQVAELKTKLDAAERCLSTQERERHQSQRASNPQRHPTRDPRQREEKEKESLNEELHELKKENKLLKEKNDLVNKKKEYYECEIKRLNKALQDALKIECSSFSEDCWGRCKVECSHEEMRTEMEVLKQQVQIYEEDFKKERSDRERLNQEKEELQQINQTSQSQLNRLNSQIKTCQMEKEKLEKQLKQMCFPTCHCNLVFPLRDAQVTTGLRAVQDQQEHTPDYQWYALDQLPPDVQHKANEITVTERDASLSSRACSASRSPCRGLNDPPLHDARVFPACGDEVAVFTEEIDVGDMAAVPAIYVAWSLEKNDTGESLLQGKLLGIGKC
ncbi:PREDICTED: TNFAIP3-interacting protein 3 [Galeopterus variegatus]|uniref:TNFAIP3-interacting protein 3 n=1 Tax=Galeopterus variegatus TaxID=482537 RepID=A0ABM0RRZ8_GALVR|nr:PREDICTED: TNFAIP3-interacting protein 3 [Galeopterus variegatus]